MNYHLVILKKPYLDEIIAGRKTIESRLYKTRHKWLSQVGMGDKLFLKASSGAVMATAAVAEVKIFDNLTARQVAELRQRYNQQIGGDEQYWQEKMIACCGILVWLKDVQPIAPLFIRKYDRHAWVVLTRKDNFGLVDIR